VAGQITLSTSNALNRISEKEKSVKKILDRFSVMNYTTHISTEIADGALARLVEIPLSLSQVHHGFSHIKIKFVDDF